MSEIEIPNPKLKIKWGTIDKKNPSSIYLEIGTYITPKEKDEDYVQKIKEINKAGKALTNDILNRTTLLNSPFIFITDVADTRVAYNKKSYMTFQIHFARKKDEEAPKNFKGIVGEIDTQWKTAYEQYQNLIEENGFNCYKTKN